MSDIENPAGDTRPIGVFDSGLGGLTVARAIATALPHESVYYFGDTRSEEHTSELQSRE